MIQVSGKWGTPAGRVNATITARAGEQSGPQATLPIRGEMIGNFEVSPDIIRFHIDTSNGEAKPETQVITFVSTTDDVKYHILGFQDKYSRLAFHVDTIAVDKQYEVTVTPQPAVLRTRQNVSGTITITTDDEAQPSITVSYAVYFGR